jgi:hypothetical protein
VLSCKIQGQIEWEGSGWEIGRSGVKIWGSLLNLDITTRAFSSTVKRFLPFPSPLLFLFTLNIPLRPPAAIKYSTRIRVLARFVFSEVYLVGKRIRA